ncbi:MAG: PEP-utilizing enzyme [Aggregatilineales bacterium]
MAYGTLTGKKERLWLPLGYGSAAKYGIGPKAALLDVARRYGLPVPTGIILVDEAWRRALGIGLVRRHDDGSVSVPDPSRLVFAIGFPNFEWELPGPFAVRSAFSAEDGVTHSLAGYFTSRLNVDGRDPVQMAEALRAVWESAERAVTQLGELRHDVLIMRMVAAKHSGVAFTEHAYADDLVNFTEGLADKLVSGAVAGESLSLPKLRAGEKPHTDLPDWAQRLQVLLRDVRRVFSHKRSGRDWDIEWADDGTQCWLIQVRPVTHPTRRNEAFTIANHKEILPPLPSIFMTSLIASCADRLFAYYRDFDGTLPENRPFIEVFNGRPYINLSLMVEMMRTLGLPSKLVTDSIGGKTERDYPANFRQMARKVVPLMRFGMAQLFAVGSAQRRQRALLREAEQTHATFAEAVQAAQRVYTALVTGMFSLTAAISLPMLLLRRLGVLEEHTARSRSIATELHTDLAPLRRLAAQNEAIREAIQRGALPDEPTFRAAWQKYLTKHGHRGIYESDLARPRFHEQPAPLLSMLLAPQAEHKLPRRTLKGVLSLPLAWQANRTVRAREQLRYHAMRAFDGLRANLLRLAAQAVANGQLPAPESLWELTIDEVVRLDQGWKPDAVFFAERAAEIARLKTLPVPDLLHRFDNLERASAPETNGPQLRGISLTTGQVCGRAWVLQEPSHAPPPFAPPVILVARSVDAGWIPAFAQVQGVVVETGGDLSHGSIILREIGLPSVTNVHGATRRIQTGDWLRLEAGRGLIHLEAAPAADV